MGLDSKCTRALSCEILFLLGGKGACFSRWVLVHEFDGAGWSLARQLLFLAQVSLDTEDNTFCILIEFYFILIEFFFVGHTR